MAKKNVGAKLVAIAITALIVQLCALPVFAAKTFNVKNFGAVGDGTTDDTTAIKNAIAAAEAQPGNIVFFPNGNYLFSKDLLAESITLVGQSATLTSANNVADVELLGRSAKVQLLKFASQGSLKANPAITVLPLTNGFEIIGCTFPAEFDPAINVQNASNGQILGNTIAIPSIVRGKGIRLHENCRNCVIENNKITGTDTSEALHLGGIVLEEGRSIGVSRNDITTVFQGIGSGGNRVLNVENNKITNCRHGVSEELDENANVVSNRFDLMGITGSVGVVEQASQNLLIKDNVVSNISTGISIFGCKVIDVANNTVSKAVNFGIFSDSTEKLKVRNNDLTNTDRGGIVMTGTVDSQFEQNKITGTQMFGLSVTGQKITIDGNTLKDVGQSPGTNQSVIFLLSQGKGDSITNNTYRGASANLTYFIHCVEPSPPVVISGNKTNTMLPNRIGS